MWCGIRGQAKWVLGIEGLRKRDRGTWYNGRVTADWEGVGEISYAARKGSKTGCIGERDGCGRDVCAQEEKGLVRIRDERYSGGAWGQRAVGEGW